VFLKMSRKEEVPPSPASLIKPSLVTADEAWKLLEIKFSQKFKTVQRAFIAMDQDGDSYINLR
jgi:hypothetical protein